MTNKKATQFRGHQIGGDAIDESKIRPGSINSTHIADDAVTTSKIENKAISAAKLDQDTVIRLLPPSSAKRNYLQALQNSRNIPSAENPFATIEDILKTETFWKSPVVSRTEMENDKPGSVRLTTSNNRIVIKGKSGRVESLSVDHASAYNLQADPENQHVSSAEKAMLGGLAASRILPQDIERAARFAAKAGKASIQTHTVSQIAPGPTNIVTIVHDEVDDPEFDRSVIVLKKANTVIYDVSRDHGHGFWFNGKKSRQYALGTNSNIDNPEYEVASGETNGISYTSATNVRHGLPLSFRRGSFIGGSSKNADESSVILVGQPVEEPIPFVLNNTDIGYGSGAIAPFHRPSFSILNSIDPGEGGSPVLMGDHQGSFYLFWLDSGGQIVAKRAHSSGEFVIDIDLQPIALSGTWQSEAFDYLGGACVLQAPTINEATRRIALMAHSKTTGNTYIMVSTDLPDSFGVEGRSSNDLLLTFDSYIIPASSNTHSWYEFNPDRLEVVVVGQGTSWASPVAVATDGNKAKYLTINMDSLVESQAGDVGAASDSASDFVVAGGRNTLEAVLGQTNDRSMWKKVQMQMLGRYGNLSLISDSTRGGSIELFNAQGRDRVGVAFLDLQESSSGNAVLTSYIQDEHDGGRLRFWIQYLDEDGESVEAEITAEREYPRLSDIKMVNGSRGHIFSSLAGEINMPGYSYIKPLKKEDSGDTHVSLSSVLVSSGSKEFRIEGGASGILATSNFFASSPSGDWMRGTVSSVASDVITVSVEDSSNSLSTRSQWIITIYSLTGDADYIQPVQPIAGGRIVTLTSSPARFYKVEEEEYTERKNAQLDSAGKYIKEVDLAALTADENGWHIVVHRPSVKGCSLDIDGGETTRNAIILSGEEDLPAAEGASISAIHDQDGNDMFVIYGGISVVDRESQANNSVVIVRKVTTDGVAAHTIKSFSLPSLQERAYHASYAISNNSSLLTPSVAADSGFVFSIGGRSVGSLENDESRSVVPMYVSRLFVENTDDATAGMDNVAITVTNSEDFSSRIPASVKPVFFYCWDSSRWVAVVIRPPDVWIIPEGSGESWFGEQTEMPGEGQASKVGSEYGINFSKRGAIGIFQYVFESSDICYAPDIQNSKPGITHVLYYGPSDDDMGALVSMVFDPQAPSNFTWEEVEIESNTLPSALYDASLVYGGEIRVSSGVDHHLFFLYGGQTASGVFSDEIWVLDYWIDDANVPRGKWCLYTDMASGSLLRPLTSSTAVRQPIQTNNTALPNFHGVCFFGGRNPDRTTSSDFSFLQTPEYWRSTADVDIERLCWDSGGEHIPIKSYVISDPIDIKNVHAIKGPLYGSKAGFDNHAALNSFGDIKVAFGFGTSSTLYSIGADGVWSSPFSIEDIHDEAFSLTEVSLGLGVGDQATSSTNLLIESATKTFVIGAGYHYQTDDYIRIYSEADPSNYMEGTITSYSAGSLEVDVAVTGGSGTYDDWKINPYGSGSMVRGINPVGFASSVEKLYIVVSVSVLEPSDFKAVNSIRFSTQIADQASGTWERLSNDEVRVALVSPRGIALSNETASTINDLRVVVSKMLSDETTG